MNGVDSGHVAAKFRHGQNQMLRAYKIQLDPNNSQITKMRMNCGASRFAFNYALNKKKEAFDKKERTC